MLVGMLSGISATISDNVEFPAVYVVALQSSPVHPPVTEFLYSKFNFIITGHIIGECDVDLTW